MSNDSSTPTDDALRDSLEQIQRKVADVNAKAANTVTRSAGLTQTVHPPSDLENTHAALLETLRETRRALTQTERALGNLESDYADPTPRQITSEHADRLAETYDGPVTNLALMLLEHNRRKWLYHRPETRGAQLVERHGLTNTQRSWLNDLQDAWRVYDGDDDGE